MTASPHPRFLGYKEAVRAEPEDLGSFDSMRNTLIATALCFSVGCTAAPLAPELRAPRPAPPGTAGARAHSGVEAPLHHVSTATLSDITPIPRINSFSGSVLKSKPVSFELGLQSGVWLGSGVPANDRMIPFALFARFPVSGDYWARFALQYSSGDFETPHEILDIAQDPNEADIDADMSAISILGWIERVYRTSDRSEWFWQAGPGVSFVDANDVDGPVDGGGTFDITTDAGTEILGSLGGGYRHHLGSWILEGNVRWDYHIADWEVEDRNTSTTGTVDDYKSWAFLLGLSYGF